MKKRILMAFIILSQNIAFADDSTINEAQKIANEYTKKIQDNNGSLKGSSGLYLTKVFYKNNKLTYQFIYNKNELIASWQKKLTKGKEYIKKFIDNDLKDSLLLSQYESDIIQYCNSSKDPLIPLIQNGLKISINTNWDDGKKFMHYEFSQRFCDKLSTKRKILYKLGIYNFRLKSLSDTKKEYLKAKKMNIKPHKIKKIHGIHLKEVNEIHRKILNGKEKSFPIKLENGQYIMIEVMEGFQDLKDSENELIHSSKNIIFTRDKCIKFYGKKIFQGMEELDSLMNDKGNALKQCQKEMNQK